MGIGTKNKPSENRSAVQHIEIPSLNVVDIEMRVVGDSPLIVNRMSEKQKRQMEQAQTGAPRAKKPPKEPWQCFCDSMYWLSTKPEMPTEVDIESATFGFPAVAFKAAAVGAARYVDGLNMTYARGAFHVLGDLLPIESPPPEMRQDVVRNSGPGRVADLRYRGAFMPWAVNVVVRFDPNAITEAQVVHLLNRAGFHMGVGEWRAEKSASGSFGMFHVAVTGEE